MFCPIESVANILLEQDHGFSGTREGYPYIPVAGLRPEEIQAIADAATQNGYDVDIRDERGEELMVFVPVQDSDEPLAQMDLEKEFQKELAKHGKDESSSTTARRWWNGLHRGARESLVRRIASEMGLQGSRLEPVSTEWAQFDYDELIPELQDMLINAVRVGK